MFRTLINVINIPNSSLIVSGLNQLYQSVARLIKLCDDLLILGEKAVNNEYVSETIHSVEDAIQVKKKMHLKAVM